MVTARALTVVAISAAHAANLLPNGSFQKPTPGIVPGIPVGHTSPPGAWVDTPQSAAADGLMFINDYGGNALTTQLVPSTFPHAPPGTKMLHVTSSRQDSGLVNHTLQNPTGPLFTCAWIYITFGAVGVGSGLEAYTEPNVFLDRQGAWEFVDVSNQGTGGFNVTNTTVIYAEPSRWDMRPGLVADFYVHMATLNTAQGECKAF